MVNSQLWVQCVVLLLLKLIFVDGSERIENSMSQEVKPRRLTKLTSHATDWGFLVMLYDLYLKEQNTFRDVHISVVSNLSVNKRCYFWLALTLA